ncbi:unnamed protein product [Closterium sp. NIES-54]
MEREEDSGKSAAAETNTGGWGAIAGTGWDVTGKASPSWTTPVPTVGAWGVVQTLEEGAATGGGWGAPASGSGWGPPSPPYPEAPALLPAAVVEIDPYWVTCGTSWVGPPLLDQYARDTPEDVQEELEEMTYEYGGAADLPEPTEEAPPPEQGPQLISVTGNECLYHHVPMEGLPASEWPEATSFPQPLVTGDPVHTADTDGIIGIPDAVLEQVSARAFVADMSNAADKGPDEEQRDEAERNKYYLKTVIYHAKPEIWHQRLGQFSHDTLNNSIKSGVFDSEAVLLPRGTTLTANSNDLPCLICPTASLAHKLFPNLPPGYKRYEPLEKVCSDFMILSQDGLDDKQNTMTFIDACTRYVWAMNIDYLSRDFDCSVTWMKRAERQSGLKLKSFQTDGGAEFFSTQFKELSAKKGIVHRCPYPTLTSSKE